MDNQPAKITNADAFIAILSTMDNPKNPWTDAHMRSYILGLSDLPEDHFPALSKRVLQTFHWRPTVVDVLELHEEMFPTPAKCLYRDDEEAEYERQRALIPAGPRPEPTMDTLIRSQNNRRIARALPPMTEEETKEFVEAHNGKR